MTDHDDQNEEGYRLNRRSTLSAVGAGAGAMVGIGAFSGSAAAWERFHVSFNGCGEVSMIVGENDVRKDPPTVARVIVASDGEAECRTVEFTEANATTMPNKYGDLPVVTYAADGDEKILGAVEIDYGTKEPVWCVTVNENRCANTPNTPDVWDAPCVPEGHPVCSEDDFFDDIGDGSPYETDADVLNFALTLEHLEHAFYRDHLEMFSREEFEASGLVEEYSSETDQSVYDYLETIRDHEKDHVDVLSQTIEDLGGEPVPEAEYDFGVESVDGFLQTARVLEKTGVGAYTGAAPFIENPDLVEAAGSILSVEANHMSLLNDITGMSPIPVTYGPVLSQEEVLDAAGPFIKSEEADSDEDDDSNGNSDSDRNSRLQREL